MPSRRFPGKVLAPFRGVPLIKHVISAVREVVRDTVVVTSTEASDDPLAAYAATMDVAVFRGPRDDVLERFRRALQKHPAELVLRVCADSPLLAPPILRSVLAEVGHPGIDLVTTTFPRTFPRGQNAELIRSRTLLSLDRRALTAHDREHVTAFFYRQPERFRIVNVTSCDPRLAALSLAVDTLADLERLSQISPYDLEALSLGWSCPWGALSDARPQEACV